MTMEDWKIYFGDEFSAYEGYFDQSAIPQNVTLPPLPSDVIAHVTFLDYLEYTTVTYFSIEFLVRFIFCPYKKNFFYSFLNWTDIISLILMYSEYVVHAVNPKEKYTESAFNAIHCLQIIRVFRLFRLVKNDVRFLVMRYTIKSSGKEVLLLSLYILVAMLFFSAFVYFTGDKSFPSIPDAFWWAIITMTTVGYGDVYPVLPLSKAVAVLTAITGLCLYAIVIPIFVNNFMMIYSYSKVWGGGLDQEYSWQSKRRKNKGGKDETIPLSRKIGQAENSTMINTGV